MTTRSPTASARPDPPPEGPARSEFRPRPERGAAVLEMALILPVLLLLVMGIIEFGRAYNARITLTHATREGARELAITGDQDAAVEATVKAATSLDPDLLTVSPSDCVPGGDASVYSSYPFDYSIAFFGSGTITMESTAVMRCGG